MTLGDRELYLYRKYFAVSFSKTYMRKILIIIANEYKLLVILENWVKEFNGGYNSEIL